jgi:hypothetical protein
VSSLVAEICPRKLFSLQDGLRNLRAEAQSNPKLRRLLSEKWGSALQFYERNYQYKIPTRLSTDLAKIGIRVDSRKTESEILASLDSQDCLPKTTGLNQGSKKEDPGKIAPKKPSANLGKPPYLSYQPVFTKPPKTGDLPQKPTLSRLLKIVGGKTSSSLPPFGMGKLGGLDELFAGKSKPSIPQGGSSGAVPHFVLDPPSPSPSPTAHIISGPPSSKSKPIKPEVSQSPSPETDAESPSTEAKPTQPSERTPSPPSDKQMEGKNPIFALDIKAPEDINRSSAEIILAGIGLMGPKSVHKLSYQEALEALHRGKTYTRKPKVKLDSVTKIRYGPEKSMREMVFEEYQRLKEAIRKYPDQPLISKKNNPELFSEWVESSAPALTNLKPSSDRRKLMLSLMSRESGQTHWRNFIPITSGAAAVGFGQFLPRTAEGYKINPYDPEQNIKGIAIMLNEHLKTKSLKDALIFYNAGAVKPTPQAAIDYANAIIRNMKNY